MKDERQKRIFLRFSPHFHYFFVILQPTLRYLEAKAPRVIGLNTPFTPTVIGGQKSSERGGELVK